MGKGSKAAIPTAEDFTFRISEGEYDKDVRRESPQWQSSDGLPSSGRGGPGSLGYDNLSSDSDDSDSRSKAMKLEGEWEAKFRLLQEFKESKGHCNVPSKYPHNPTLATWVQTQRSRHRKGVMIPARQRKLKDLGFDFNPKNMQLRKTSSLKSPKRKQAKLSVKPVREVLGECGITEKIEGIEQRCKSLKVLATLTREELLDFGLSEEQCSKLEVQLKIALGSTDFKRLRGGGPEEPPAQRPEGTESLGMDEPQNGIEIGGAGARSMRGCAEGGDPDGDHEADSELMLDSEGNGLSVLEVLHRIGSLDSQQLRSAQDEERGQEFVVQQGWVTPEQVKEAVERRENTKYALVRQFHRVRDGVQVVNGKEYTSQDVVNRQLQLWFEETRGVKCFPHLVDDDCPSTQLPGARLTEPVVDLPEYLESGFQLAEYVNRSLTLEDRIERFWREGWNVTKHFGPKAAEVLKAKFEYFPLRGTGIGVMWRRMAERIEIASVNSSGPAVGKLKPGDVILMIDGHQITLERQVHEHVIGHPGTELEMLILPRENFTAWTKEAIELDDCKSVTIRREDFDPQKYPLDPELTECPTGSIEAQTSRSSAAKGAESLRLKSLSLGLCLHLRINLLSSGPQALSPAGPIPSTSRMNAVPGLRG
eukprot:CAMPEP_0184315896 /NCGR_PEP_ID=MMETSP1049-20130417/86485_1 /TAXON_ID=77928 /ORGANISM="Proteomonas sulcata, Strain CCMP704" /LENGTH=647 /DNA_ID=CAMNT_0026634627 /DNA_START=56 /DNA_END=2001 /DNA_ORIENTATION=+